MNLNHLIQDMGTTAEALPGLLDQMAADVADDTATILDGHPRFGEHVALMGWAQVTWEDIDTQAEDATNDAEFNAITRTVIGRVKEAI